MRYTPMSLLILLGLSMTACPEEKEKEKPVYTHQAPRIVKLSDLSEDSWGNGYQYVQDQTTGLCFIERNQGYIGGMAPILCEAIPTIQPTTEEN